MAHQGELDAPRLLGRKPDRLRQGRHARAAAPGRPARSGKMDAARSAGARSSSWLPAPRSKAGHSPSSTARFTGIKPESRPGRRRMGSSTNRSRPGFGRARAVRAAGLPENIKKIVALERSKRNESQTKELQRLLHRACVCEDGESPRALADEDRAGRAASARSSRNSSRPRWSFARRRARPSPRFCSSAANMTSGARRSSAGCRRSCRRFRRARRSIVWAWRTG